MGTLKDELHGQFLLCERADIAPPESWNTVRCGQWSLHHAADLPVTPITDTVGLTRGWLVGWAVEGRRFVESVQIEGDPQAGFADRFSDTLRGFGGRFAAALVDDPSPRFELDALGSLAAVYRADKRIVASTPTAAHFDALDPFVARCLAEPEMVANGYFLADLTRTDDTRRLLPHFYLDLNTFAPRRCWPTAPLTPLGVDDAAERVLDAIGDILEGIASRYPIQHGLSAGRDTRLILAAAKRRGIDIDWYTFNYDDPQKAGDVELACEIAKRMKLRHRVISLDTPPQSMREDYLFRVGYCANSGKTCDQYDGCLKNLNLRGAMGIGYGGEAGRGMYWRAALPASRPDAASLLRILKLRHADPRQPAAAERWLATIPDFLGPAHVLDLAYVELRAGCWGMPQMYGAAPVACYFVPLCRHDVKASLMSMSESVRSTQGGILRMIELGAPEVADVPFELPRRVPGGRKSLIRRGVGWIARHVPHRAHH
jgi:hypothetical protein